ncbi:MAG: 16S rRNA (guanine(527)-N(7))-methyltransferase RsmG, partial [Spirochaetaceae bacterium]|nr:16S rRNA (guanine(527)-N(7))-methyltransferase RsmG [Spirochaetaceae bacterium]
MDEWILNHDYGKNGSTDRLEAGITSLCRSDPDIERLLGPEILGVIPLLQRYIAEIERFNPFYHLVKVQNQEELVIKHILDSLG